MKVKTKSSSNKNSINKTILSIQTTVNQYTKKFEAIDKRFDRVEERLDTLTGSVMAIEGKLDVIVDIHQELMHHKTKIEDHEERIVVLEEHASI